MIDNKIMLAVPVSESFEDNMELDLYCDAKKGSYRYLGLYEKKAIRAVGKVTKIVIFKNVNGNYETDVPVTDDEKEKFLELRRRVLKDKPHCNFGEMEERIFFVDKFYPTEYKNIGSTGILGGKKISLEKLLPATTSEIAAQLNGQTWQLVNGQDIIPIRKNIPLVADKIMLAVPVSETYNFNTKLNIYFSASKKNIHEYIGLYEKKSIRAVGKIVKVIDVEKVNEKILIKNEVTPEEERKVLEYKKLCEEANVSMKTPGKIYFVDKFYPTDYKNTGTMGIMNSKKISLKKLLPTTTSEIAAQLNGQTWQLVNGQDIIPERRRNIDL